MDIDSSLLHDWEDEAFPLCDDDIDIAMVSSMQSEFDTRFNPKLSSDQVNPKAETFFRSLDEDLDFAFALSLQEVYDENFNNDIETLSVKPAVMDTKGSKPLSIVDEQWELIDPHPDVHALFLEYDATFFYGKLQGVEVKWSKRMTLCAGVCSYEGRGGLCSVRLSLPLLKLRPRRDLVETLLHEMIHAYLFVTCNNRDREGHGPEFLSHMNRINKATGTKISVYHSFHDEVDLYRQHWWKCDGPCRNRRPFFGIVKRAMNRAPGPKDNWWSTHQVSCGGTFLKIKEPDNYKKQGSKRKADSDSKELNSDIRLFLKDENEISKSNSSKGSSLNKGSSSKSSVFRKGSVSSKSNGSSKDNCSSNGGLIQPKPLMTNSSNIATISSVSNDHVVPARPEDLPTKKDFMPFQGSGFKLGGSAKISSAPPYWSLHKNLSSSQKAPEVASHSQTPKLSRLSSELKNSGLKSHTSGTPDNAAKKLIQSPMERFFKSPKTSVYTKVPVEKSTSPASCFKSKETDGGENMKVSCPICSMLVENAKINTHLDDCLKN